ncbi:MAG: hypothetical protein MJ203_00325 [archaeon]|nr:hypothetical protein [archaeon]
MFFVACFLLSLQSVFADETCSSGMIKTYLDETTASAYKAARLIPLSLNFGEGSGALWYRRKMRIDPRFEIHFKASMDPVEIIEEPGERNFEGFTIVLSKSNNTIGEGSGEHIGYYGFTKSYVIEFDFNKNLVDKEANGFSLKYCDNDCDGDDTSAIKTGNLLNQRYDPSKPMSWDFRVVYEDKKLNVYSGSSDILFSYDVDLKEKFGTDLIYVGFTGYMNGNRRELSLSGTFVCEDNMDLTKTDGKFYVRGEAFDTYSYQTDSPIKYRFTFYNSKGQKIPHYYGLNIWNYNLSASFDCSANESAKFYVLDDYTLQVNTHACSKVGSYKLRLWEETKGFGSAKYYTVIPGDIAYVTLIGHDGKIGEINQEYDTKTNGIILKYGKGADGNFPIKENNVSFVLDFSITDKYGNIIDLENDSTYILQKSKLELANPGVRVSMKKYQDHYQFTFVATKPGTYQINPGKYMNLTIDGKEYSSYEVIVTESGPDLHSSICEMVGENSVPYNSTPALNQKQTVEYRCYFKNALQNPVKAEDMDSYDYEFSCEIERKTPEAATIKLEPVPKGDYFSCKYEIDSMGDYSFHGYMKKKKNETQREEVAGTIYSFVAYPYPKSLKGGYVYNPNNGQWVPYSQAEFNFRGVDKGFVTAFDMTESDHKTLISSSKGGYPQSFDLKKVKAVLTSPHDPDYKFQDLSISRVQKDGKQYLGIYMNETLKKSSFPYEIVLTFNDEEERIPINYVFPNPLTIGDRTTCFHDLDISKTKVTVLNKDLVAGDPTAFLSIELTTEDGYLYNYDIGKDKIKVMVDEKNGGNFTVIPETILGTYTIYGDVTSGNKVSVYINDEKLKQDIDITVSVNNAACYLEPVNSDLFKINDNTYTLIDSNPENLNFDFKLYDANHKEISQPDYKLTNTEVSEETKQEGDFTIKYSTTKKTYTFDDVIEQPTGKFTWVINLKDCNRKYYFEYKKVPGDVSTDKSRYEILTPNIYVNETGYVDVILKDDNGTNIGTDEKKIKEALNKIKVEAKSDKKTIPLEYETITGDGKIRYKKPFYNEGEYKVVVTYNDKDIPSEDETTINIKQDYISDEKSKMYVTTDKTTELIPGSQFKVDNTITTPIFNYTLINSDGDVVTKYDKSIDFKCVFDIDGEKIVLDVTKEDSFITCKFDDKLADKFSKAKKGYYTFEYKVGPKTIKNQVYLTGGEESNEFSPDDYDIDKTDLGLSRLDAIAGLTYTITLDFRAADNLRWNNDGDPSKFTYKNSLGLTEKDLKFNAEKGTVPGQFLIYMTPYKVTEKGQENIITIYYDKKEIPTKVALTVKCGELGKLELNKKVLEGTVDNLPYLQFIPYDKYGNLYTDLFDPSIWKKEYLNGLVLGEPQNDVYIYPDNWVSDGKYLYVQYKATSPTKVDVTSPYFKEKYTLTINGGNIDPDKTFAKIIEKTGQTAGSEYTIRVDARDPYSNKVAVTDEDMENFRIYYKTPTSEEIDITKDCKLADDRYSFDCKSKVITAGPVTFNVKFGKKNIECTSCTTNIKPGEISFKKTQIYNTNPYYTTGIPTFEMELYDDYNNKIDNNEEIESYEVEAKLEGTDVKLCVYDVDGKKTITVCQPNGDDNYNKFLYLNNKEYTITVYKGSDKVETKLLITNNSGSGSSAALDLSKTYFNPSEFDLVAGEKLIVLMELRAVDGLRKNSWYPDFKDDIKLDFTEPDYCDYNVLQASLPGQYYIQISCTQKAENSFYVSFNGTKINQKLSIHVKAAPAYTIEVQNPEKYDETLGRYVLKTNPTNDENIQFSFKLKDQFGNYLNDLPLSKVEAYIYSSGYGNDESKYTITNSNGVYTVKEKIYEAIGEHSWTVICRGSRATFAYKRLPGKPVAENSYYYLNINEMLIEQTSYVLIALRDRYSVEIKDEDQIKNIRKQIVVSGIKGTEKVNYEYDTTVENQLVYKAMYPSTGSYVVEATYNGQKLTPDGSNKLIISNQKYAIDSNVLTFVRGKEEYTLSPNKQNNIDNTKGAISFRYYLATEKGEQIKNYDKNIKITCKLTQDQESKRDLVVTKSDNYVTIDFQDKDKRDFTSLKAGKYNLVLNVDGEERTYILNLFGDSVTKQYSSSSKIDISKTTLSDTVIYGTAGVPINITLEFRASDGLRWNNVPSLNDFIFSNKLNLPSTQFKAIAYLGKEKGQVIISITQNKVSMDTPNIVNIQYGNYKVIDPIHLYIRCGEVGKLNLVTQPKDGTVLEPPTLKFTATDKYGNQWTTQNNQVNTIQLVELTNATNSDGEKLYPYVYADNDYIYIEYQSMKSTTVTVTSKYFDNEGKQEEIKYKLLSGPISAYRTTAEVRNGRSTNIGDYYVLDIYPKDVYGNPVDNLDSNTLKDFKVTYETPDDENKRPTEKGLDISDKCTIVYQDEYSIIECIYYVETAGNLFYRVLYKNMDVFCESCRFYVKEGEIDFTKTEVRYLNTEEEISGKPVYVKAGSVPEFEVVFKDRYGNIITHTDTVRNVDFTYNIEGVDIKLCATNKLNTKVITVCPDQVDKWYTTTNGLRALTLDFGGVKVDYSIIVNDGVDGSSGEMSLCKTEFSPTTLTLVAGVEKIIKMELKDDNGNRKNGWLDNVDSVVDIKFSKDADSCSHRIERSNIPGIYNIKVKCSKAREDNLIYVKVETSTIKKTTQTVKNELKESNIEEKNKETETFKTYNEAYNWAVQQPCVLDGQIETKETQGSDICFDTNQDAVSWASKNGYDRGLIQQKKNGVRKFEDKTITEGVVKEISVGWANLHEYNYITIDGDLKLGTHTRGSVYVNGNIYGGGAGIDDTYDHGIPIQTTSYVKGTSNEVDGTSGRNGLTIFKNRKKKLQDSTNDIKNYWSTVIQQLLDRGLAKQVRNSDELRDKYMQYHKYQAEGSDSAIRSIDDSLVYVYLGTDNFDISNWYSFQGVLFAPNAHVYVPWCNWCGTIVAKSIESNGEAHPWAPRNKIDVNVGGQEQTVWREEDVYTYCITRVDRSYTANRICTTIKSNIVCDEPKTFSSYNEAFSWANDIGYIIKGDVEIIKGQDSGTYQFDTREKAVEFAKKYNTDVSEIETETIANYALSEITQLNTNGVTVNWNNLNEYNYVTLDGDLKLGTHTRGSVYVNGNIYGGAAGIDDTRDNNLVVAQTTSYVKGTSTDADYSWGRGIGMFMDRKQKLTDSTSTITNYWNNVANLLISKQIGIQVKDANSLLSYIRKNPYTAKGSDSAIRKIEDNLIFVYTGTATLYIPNEVSFKGILIAPKAKVVVPACNWSGSIVAKSIDSDAEAHAWAPIRTEKKATVIWKVTVDGYGAKYKVTRCKNNVLCEDPKLFDSESQGRSWATQQGYELKDIIKNEAKTQGETTVYYSRTEAVNYAKSKGYGENIITEEKTGGTFVDSSITSGLKSITCNWNNVFEFNFITLDGNLGCYGHTRGSVCVNGDILGGGGIDDTRDNSVVVIQTQSYVKGSSSGVDGTSGRGNGVFSARKKKLYDSATDMTNYWVAVAKRLVEKGLAHEIKNEWELEQYFNKDPYHAYNGDSQINYLSDKLIYVYLGYGTIKGTFNSQFKGLLIAPYAHVNMPGGNWAGTVVAKSIDANTEQHLWRPSGSSSSKYIVTIPSSSKITYTVIRCKVQSPSESEITKEIELKCKESKTIKLIVKPTTPEKPITKTIYDEPINKLVDYISVDKTYYIVQQFNDIYGNKANPADIPIDETTYEVIKQDGVDSDESCVLKVTTRATGDVLLTLTSKTAITCIIKNKKYPKDEFKITFIPGEIRSEKTIIEVENQNVTVGKDVNITVLLRDQYGNYINPKNTTIEIPPEIYYIKDYKKEVIPYHAIEKRGDKYVLVYKANFTNPEMNYIYGSYEEEPLSCGKSCVVDVKVEQIPDFKNSEISVYVPTSNEFVPLKEGDVQNNYNVRAIYKIEPRDQFGNRVVNFPPGTKFGDLKAELVSQTNPEVKYELVTRVIPGEEGSTVELVTDDKYTELPPGTYDVIIKNNDGTIKKNVTIAKITQTEENTEIARQKTIINEASIVFEAGDSGEMHLELRTNDNLRSSAWENSKITVESCRKDDKTFKYKVEHSGVKGQFIVTVTSEKPTTFPELIQCPLKVFIEGEELKNFHPLMIVTPGPIYTAEILSKYFKDEKNHVMLDGDADKYEYPFEIKAYDQYGNLVPADQKVIGIKVTIDGKETELSFIPQNDGSEKYIAFTPIAGTYTVSSNLNPLSGKNYLPYNAKFEVKPGSKIDTSKTIVREISDNIEAGDKGQLVIYSYDTYGNLITDKQVINGYNITFVDVNKKTYKTKIDEIREDGGAVITTEEKITPSGYTTYEIVYNKTDIIPTPEKPILVVPGSPDLKNLELIVYGKKGSSELKKYKQNETFTISTTEIPEMSVKFYDEYGNPIDDIPDDVKVINARLEGNEMETIRLEPIPGKSEIKLDFAGNETLMDIYSDLVSGKYKFTFDVDTKEEDETFTYPVNIVTGKDDKKYGNGDVDVSKSIVGPENLNIKAGEYETVNVELRTKEGKLYNKDINPENIIVEIDDEDPTFKYEVKKTNENNGFYGISVTSEKSGKNNMTVSYYDDETKKTEKIGVVKYNVISDPQVTSIELVTPLKELIEPETSNVVEFKIKDQFGNVIKNRPDYTDNFRVLDFNKDITSSCKITLEKGEVYKIVINPNYPPVDRSINILYEDENGSRRLFTQDIKVTLKREIDYQRTEISSKNSREIMVEDILDMKFYLYDIGNNCIEKVDYGDKLKVEVIGPIETAPNAKKEYTVKKTENPLLDCQNEYQIITSDKDKYTKKGNYTINIYADGKKIQQFNQICRTRPITPDQIQWKEYEVTAEPGKFIIDFIAVDDYNNTEFVDDFEDHIEATINTTTGTPVPFRFVPYDLTNGTRVILQIFQAGQFEPYFMFDEHPLSIFDNEQNISGPKPYCTSENKTEIDESPLVNVSINKPATFIVICYDQWGNRITHGGDDFTSNGRLLLLKQGQTKLETTIVDNNDGSYNVNFIPKLEGDYYITVYLRGERFGDDVHINLETEPCFGEKSIKCQDSGKCVEKISDCYEIPEPCTRDKPFSCLVGGETKCVESQKDCDCPPGFYRCGWQHYCVPEERKGDMCPEVITTNKTCSKDTFVQTYIVFVDGICRTPDEHDPNQLVCPMGKVLCADLSCRDSYYDCYVPPNPCPADSIRCINQQCKVSNDLCPSTYACKNPLYKACPDGTCVKNEIECTTLPKCDGELGYLCANLECAHDNPSCADKTSCGHGADLCSDSICRKSCTKE